MELQSLDDFRKQIDEDEGLKSKRRVLISLSALLLAITFSGAALKEANTFILKVEFTNHIELTYFLAASVVFLLLRYYGYAQVYHSQLYSLWSSRLLNDYRVFSYIPKEEEIRGLLGKRIDTWVGDEPGLQHPRYKKIGLLKRNIEYTSSGYDEMHGDYEYNENIELSSFTKEWTVKDYLTLLKFEFRYRVEAVLKYRESLDIIFPYILGGCALISFAIKHITKLS